jgi:hypothetical protein
VHNHAQAIVACDFFVVFTARFRILYVLVITELGRCQILHHNVTAHPSAEWTLQQFRDLAIADISRRVTRTCVPGVSGNLWDCVTALA